MKPSSSRQKYWRPVVAENKSGETFHGSTLQQSNNGIKFSG